MKEKVLPLQLEGEMPKPRITVIIVTLTRSYSVPGTVLSALHELTQFLLITTL